MGNIGGTSTVAGFWGIRGVTVVSLYGKYTGTFKNSRRVLSGIGTMREYCLKTCSDPIQSLKP